MTEEKKAIVLCPSCGQKIRIPTNRGHITFPCSGCQTQLDWSPEPLKVEVEAVFDKADQPTPEPSSADPQAVIQPDTLSENQASKTEEPSTLAQIIFLIVSIGGGVFVGLAVFGFLPAEMSEGRSADLGFLRIIGTYLVSIIAGFLAGLAISLLLGVINKLSIFSQDQETSMGSTFWTMMVFAGITYATTVTFFHQEQWVQIPRQLIVEAANGELRFDFESVNPDMQDSHFKGVKASETTPSEMDELMESW